MTKLFRQEIEYVVLVHSPQFNENFSRFPLLTSSPWVAYDGHQIIWKAQAICETHNFQLVIRGKTAMTECMSSHQFYVWDHVSLVFHSKDILTVPKRKLKASLSCCELDRAVNLSKGKNCSSLDEAEKFIKTLPDDESDKEDEKEEYKPAEVKIVDLSKGENCSSLDKAEKFIKTLPDDESDKEDEKDEYKPVKVKVEIS